MIIELEYVDGYFVDKNGNVFKRIKGSVNSGGYKRIGGAKGESLIHRLVTKAFIPNPKNLPFVNHIDGNKQNNSVENLEWVTPQENTIHAWTHNLCTKHFLGKHHTEETKKKMSETKKKLGYKPIPRSRKIKNLTTGEVFNSLKEAGKSCGSKSGSNIQHACAGKYKKAYGCEWTYL